MDRHPQPGCAYAEARDIVSGTLGVDSEVEDGQSRWRLKQELAKPGRFYGGAGTIHGTERLDVEVCDGRVVAVWFRCQPLPFRQVEVDTGRRDEMDGDSRVRLTGVEVVDR